MKDQGLFLKKLVWSILEAGNRAAEVRITIVGNITLGIYEAAC